MVEMMSTEKQIFYCPYDQWELNTTDDRVGGGSHYWSYKYPKCERVFVFDTYRFLFEGVTI
jgi:hypothetical protein